MLSETIQKMQHMVQQDDANSDSVAGKSSTENFHEVINGSVSK